MNQNYSIPAELPRAYNVRESGDFSMTLREKLVGAVNRGTRNAFGVMRRDNGDLFLITRERWLPIFYLRLRLTTDREATPICATEKNLAWRIALADGDDVGNSAQIVVFPAGNSPDIVSSASDELLGSLFVAAGIIQQGREPTTYVLDAVFRHGESSVLADATSDLVRHLTVSERFREDLINGSGV